MQSQLIHFEKDRKPALNADYPVRLRTSMFVSLPPFANQSLSKRVFDVVMSSLMLLAAAPLMAVIALLVKLDSAGPVFYSQVRVGQNRRKRNRISHFEGTSNRRASENFGKPFNILKFRSMKVDAEAGGKAVWCQANDPRVTRMGNILRKTHLDELPQLFNVLKGDMSLVGPRPERPEFISKLAEEIPNYEARLLLKPGLTGLAQIRHRSDIDMSDVKKKLKYDITYLKSSSVAADLKIMIGTAPIMFGFPIEQARKITRVRNTFSRTAIAVGAWVLLILSWTNKQ